MNREKITGRTVGALDVGTLTREVDIFCSRDQMDRKQAL